MNLQSGVTDPDLLNALEAKAAKDHSHTFRDFIDLKGFLDVVRSNQSPRFDVFVHLDTLPCYALVNFMTTHGYSMSTVSIVFKYRARNTLNKQWTLIEPVTFIDSQFEYKIPFKDLLAKTDYEYVVTLIDSNNPNLQASAGLRDFTTI